MTENGDKRRVALVTGGSRGIGRAVAIQLAEDGFDVAFCYRSAATEVVETLQKQILDSGVRALAVQADVADAGAMRAMAAQVSEELGPVEVLVTAAGIVRDAPLLMMDDEQWNEVLTTNLDGTYHACRAVVFEMMKQKKGSIINISSVAGVYGNPTQTNYSASKAGIIGFTRALAKECGRYNIRANVVAPGFIATDMTANISGKVLDQAMKSIPLRRFGQPEEVAGIVSYLASDKASYVTGATFQIDGGIII